MACIAGATKGALIQDPSAYLATERFIDEHHDLMSIAKFVQRPTQCDEFFFGLLRGQNTYKGERTWNADTEVMLLYLHRVISFPGAVAKEIEHALHAGEPTLMETS